MNATMDINQGIGKGDPVEVIKFWCWSNSECGCNINFPLSL